jgi:Probable lipoprotein LpqN
MPRRPMVAAFTVVCLSAMLAACGSQAKEHASTATQSATSSSASSPTTKADAGPNKLQARDLKSAATAATNPTIADYIRDQHITETQIHNGDPDTPQIDVPVPDGWQTAGDKTPDFAYGAIVYTGPDAQGADYTPNIIAVLSKLEGPVDPDKLLQVAGGEMKNLPGFVPAGDETATVSGFPAYRIAGEYDLQGNKAASGQETILISGQSGLYVLQLNATSNENQSKALFDALEAIDKTIKITA